MKASAATLVALVAVSVAVPPAGAATLDHTGWFTFPMAWDDTAATVVDQSWSVEAPAGSHGFLTTTSDGRFRFSDGGPSRVRFSGFTQVSSSNFPDSADAVVIARRLRKFGVNFLRLHLIENDFGTGTSIYPASGTTLAFDADRLARMDWFAKCLRDQGVYYNFCIHAGRIFRADDGIVAPVTNDLGKVVTLFDPTLIGLQKTWARMLAEHVNPYTGLAYKDDPAVATWELTNENQLFQAWLSWGSSTQWDTTGYDSDAGMHPWYHREFDSLWNVWLAGRYASRAALETAWSPAGSAGAEQVGNPAFESGTSGWSWWYDATTDASMKVSVVADSGLSGSKALRVEMTGQGTNTYDANVHPSPLTVETGKTYRFAARMKGSQATTVLLEFVKETTWDWYGSSTCAVDTGWTTCEAFMTSTVDLQDSLRAQFGTGLAEGRLLFDSVSFAEYGGTGLAADEDPASTTVRRSTRGTLAGLSAGRLADETRFYLDVEAAYQDGLTSLLKDSLGIRVPVTFTNNWYGLPSIASQARADYLDTHAYWDHPSFTNGWSETAFTQNNVPMAAASAWGTVPILGLSRVAGKPLVASEYNEPWPNQYLAEAPAFYYGYLGYMDADGALMHAWYDGQENFKSPAYRSFFNVGMNPVLLVQQNLARLFRQGAIAPTSAFSDASVTDSALLASSRRLDLFPFTGGEGAAVVRPVRWTFGTGSDVQPAMADPGTRAVSTTGELDWDRSAGILRVDAPAWKGLVGYLAGGAEVTGFGTSGISTTAGRDFAAVHLASLDSQAIEDASGLLLVTAARMENKGTTWASAFDHVTRPYTSTDSAVCEPVSGAVWLLPGRTDSVSVYPLDPTGARRAAIGITWSGDTLSFSLPGTTLWYEIAKGDATSPVVSLSEAATRTAGLAVRPVSGGWMVSASRAVSGDRLVWTLRDVAGRTLARGSGEATQSRIEAPRGTGLVLLDLRLERDGAVVDRRASRLGSVR